MGSQELRESPENPQQSSSQCSGASRLRFTLRGGSGFEDRIICPETIEEGKSAINLSNLGKFCQIWPWAIYLG